MKDIRLCDIAGYMTEKSVWRLVAMLSSADCDCSNISSSSIVVSNDVFSVVGNVGGNTDKASFIPSEACDSSVNDAQKAWIIGAVAFYALMGTYIFEGKGGATQTADTQVPRVSSSHCGGQLSSLIYNCLSFDPMQRPSVDEIRNTAVTCLGSKTTPGKRLSGSKGVAYSVSLVDFWPENMVSVVATLLLTLCSLSVSAQGKFEHEKELDALVKRFVDLRSAPNTSRVTREFKLDTEWTLMDEIAIDRNGECTTKDEVITLGVNNIAYRIAKVNGGVTNASGRFRNGQDPRYKYSFIEVTAKKDKTIGYDITGREGAQKFAVVCCDPAAQFSVSVTRGGKPMSSITTPAKDGVIYVGINDKLKKNDVFRISVKNISGKNMSFVIVNYNSRK